VTGPRVWQAAVVFVLAAATFLPALHNGPLGDDSILLEQRLDSTRAPGVAALFQQSYWDDLHSSGLYRPLSLTLLLAERRALGLSLAPYRVVNLLLHGLCSILVLQLLRRLVSSRAALAGAVLFAVHPIHAEAVITVYGQEDLWCAFFFLAALNSDRWPAPPAHGALRLGSVAVFSLLSLLCKEQSVLLPALLLFFRERSRNRHPTAPPHHRIDPRPFVLLAPLLVYGALRVYALGTEVAPTGESSVALGYPWWARVNLILVSAGTYLRLLVVPWGQTTYYGHLRDALFGTPVLETAVVLLAAVSFLLLSRALGRTVVNHASAIVAATLIPVSNLLPIGLVVGERCLYLPSVGICIAAAAAYAWLEARGAKAAVAAVCAASVIGVVLSARVALRWQTPLRLWETTIADHPRSAGAHARLALLLLNDVAESPDGPADPRVTRAEDALHRALEINPGNSEAWEGRGLLALLRRDCAAAAAAFQRVGPRRPDTRDLNRLLQQCAK